MSILIDLDEFQKANGDAKISLDDLVGPDTPDQMAFLLTGDYVGDVGKITFEDFDNVGDNVEVVIDLSTFTSDFELKFKDERPDDKIKLQGADEVTVNNNGSREVTFIDANGEERTLKIAASDATIAIDRAGGLDLGAGVGHDNIEGEEGDDTIDGGAGDDTISGGSGDDSISAGVDQTSLGGSGLRAKDFPLIKLTNHADIDINEFNGVSENASDLLGTYGDADAPLNSEIVFAYSNDLNDDDRLDDNDGGKEAETFTIQGEELALDSVQTYFASVTFSDGSSGNFTAVVIQLENGDVFLAPEPFENDDSALLESGEIQSISLDRVQTSDTNLYGLRLDSAYQVGDADIVDAGDGDDTVDGGIGDDEIKGGAGGDAIIGGAGADQLFGGSGDDVLDGGSGEDYLKVGTGADIAYGGAGDDTVQNASGDDLLFGGSGNDNITANVGADTLFGGIGDDTLTGGSGEDSLIGDSGEDILFAGSGDDELFGGDGYDQIYGGEGGDVLYGGGDYDDLYGDAGDDTLFSGTDGDTYLFGGAGADSLILSDFSDSAEGGSGADTIVGGDAGDTIFGGSGADSLIGGGGDDTLTGGSGDDTFLFADNFGNDTITGGEGGSDFDTLDFTGLTSRVRIDFSSAEAGTATSGGDTISFSQIERLLLTDGDDLVFGSNIAGSHFIDAGAGDDRIESTDGDDTVIAGSGDDSIDGNQGADLIFAGDGADTLDGDESDDTLHGGSGDDLFLGGSGNDVAFGGDGEDTLGDSSGDDSLTGGEGFDTFVLGSGNDTITDFGAASGAALNDGDQTNNDFIDLNGFYDNISEVRGDLQDDNTLNQSNATDDKGRTVDYTDNASLDGTTRFQGYSTSDFTQDSTNVVCFAAGTNIVTPHGAVLVEDLRGGDLVTTSDYGALPILWLGRQNLSAAQGDFDPASRPVRIRANALGPAVPAQDLIVSSQHRMLACGPIVERMFKHSEVLAPAKSLIGYPGIEHATPTQNVILVHFLLPKHAIVSANGAPTETFYPGETALSTLSELSRAAIRHCLSNLQTEPPVSYPPARPIITVNQGQALTKRLKKNKKTLLEGPYLSTYSAEWVVPDARRNVSLGHSPALNLIGLG